MLLVMYFSSSVVKLMVWMWEVGYIKSVSSQISLSLVTSADAARYLEKPFSVGCHEVCWSDIIVLVIAPV